MMAANFNRVDIKPDLKKAVEGFGRFKVDLADHLDVPTIQRLSILLGLKSGEIDSIKRSETPGLAMVNLLDDRGVITQTSIKDLLEMLQELKLAGLSAKIQSSFQAKTSQAKKDLYLEEEQLDASTAPSSPAKSPPSQKGDRTEEQLVASSASSVPAKSPPSQKGDRTDVKDKLFISFSSKIKERVTELVERIESLVGDGSCWMYTTRNKPGESLPQEIVDAIHKADIVLCMITQDYIDSEPCEEEFLLAKKLKKQIILLHMEKDLQPYKKTNGRNSPMQLATADQLYARMYIEKHEEEFQKVIDKIKECLPGKDANASDDSEVKVTRKE